jgi:hypothetical protein
LFNPLGGFAQGCGAAGALDVGGAVDPANEAGQDIARAKLDKSVDARLNHCGGLFSPAHPAFELAAKKIGPI